MVRTTTAARPSDLCPSALHSPMGELTGFHLSATIAFNCSEVLEPRRLEMATTTHISIKRTIRRQQLREMVPLADSTIYEMEQRGEFPRRFALSPRCVVWDLAEVEAWLASRRSAPIARAQSPRCQAAALAPGSKRRVGLKQRHRRRDERRHVLLARLSRRQRCPTIPASCADAALHIRPCCRRRERIGRPHAQGTSQSSRC